MRRGPLPALLAILVAAAALRVTGLSWGLRHRAMEAERDFVHSVWQMVEARDLDQRFYEYPGLFFFLLYGPVAAVQWSGGAEADAFLAARGLVAAFGVASVALTFVLGRRLAGERVGLLAALLLAVSPLEVETAHRVRPDVVLETFGLLALLAFGRVGERWSGDVKAGLALGLAGAIKPTGAFLVPSYLGSRLLAPGPKLRGIATAGALSIVAVFALTPYFFIQPRRFAAGARAQVSYHYAHDEWSADNPARPDAPTRTSGSGVVSRPALVLFYVRNLGALLGLPGAILLGVGLVTLRREWRVWLPLLALVVVTLAVVCSAEMGHARFLVPLGGVLAVVVARVVDDARKRTAAGGLALALVTPAVPAVQSLGYVRGVVQPTPLDQVLDWIQGHAADGARVLSTSPHLGLDATRLNVALPGRRTGPQNRIVAREVDLVVADPADPIVAGFTELVRARAAIAQAGPDLGVYTAPPGLRRDYRPVPLDRARLAASENAGALPALLDGDPKTAWRMSEARPEPWLEVDLPAAARLGRVRLVLKRGLGTDVRVTLTNDGSTWREVTSAGFQTTVQGPIELTLYFDAETARGLRLEAVRPVPLQWAVGELAVDAVSP